MLKNSIILLDSSTLVSEALPLLFPLMHHTPLTIHLLRFVPRSGEPAGEDLSFLQEQTPSLQIFERPCSTAREVLERAAKVEAESIVVVAHDRNNLSGGAFGTLVVQLMINAACPVILLGGRVSIDTCRTILIVLDGTPESERMLSLASELAYLNNARIVLIPPVTSNPMRDNSHYTNELLSQVANYLNWVAGSLRSSGLRADAIHTTGDSTASMLDHTERERVDLIMVAEHLASQDEGAGIIQSTEVPVIIYGAKKAGRYNRYRMPDVVQQLKARDMLPV